MTAVSARPADSDATPLVSLLLITYRQRDTIAAAIAGALAQDYSPLEIIVSDDASDDGTFEAAAACLAGYAGPHRIVLRRNACNQGISAHLSALAALAQGELLFVAAGDDISVPDRCSQVVAFWLADARRPDLIATDLVDMDEHGGLHATLSPTTLDDYRGFEDWAARRPHLIGASHTWTRRLFDRFGPMQPGLFGEDQIMTFRAIMSGGARSLHAPLVHYRRGGLSARRARYRLDDYIARLRFTNRHGLSEIEQLRADAARAGCGERMRDITASKYARERFMQQQFDSSDWRTRVALLFGSREVGLPWRIRVFLYANCPAIYRPFFFLRRLTRRRDRR
ncbi:glycosyltransferase family 2 protein [Chitinasiproducens palmae]|uniref:Glycosyltransferase involved in cell wall bisynthesis n=1 Tax=Chitinasiproducens palmae TaxID=1770053 RepID=A0A1H2PTK7_9BURK|nr:glycosyltransferase family 2 protein [Chitinasiproducens palmae]SDV50066.1 Glycosyltransferase involved in cell wall bisynthesis [Chitinasiproducens palmae]